MRGQDSLTCQVSVCYMNTDWIVFIEVKLKRFNPVLSGCGTPYTVPARMHAAASHVLDGGYVSLSLITGRLK